ncbi:hypothetical protein [Deinococcus aquaticus]|uniref:hypothetical protein n=1 Tax=Deinococcus aquaticus TaxID=328692 RepID=UPI003615AD5E
MTGQPLELRWDTAEVLQAWIEQLPGGYVFTVQDAVSTLELAGRSVRRQLPRFAPDLVTIVPGTGRKARPLQFQRVASLAVLPEPLPAVPSMPLPEDEQDREEEPLRISRRPLPLPLPQRPLYPPKFPRSLTRPGCRHPLSLTRSPPGHYPRARRS